MAPMSFPRLVLDLRPILDVLVGFSELEVFPPPPLLAVGSGLVAAEYVGAVTDGTECEYVVGMPKADVVGR